MRLIEVPFNKTEIKYLTKPSFRGKQYVEYYIGFTSWIQVEEFGKVIKAEKIVIDGHPIGNEHELEEKEIDRLYKKITIKGENEALKNSKSIG